MKGKRVRKGTKRLRKGRLSWAGSIYFISSFKAKSAQRIDDDICFRVMTDELEKLKTEDILECLAFVLMPDHFHMIIKLEPDANLSLAMKRFKGACARKINKARGKSGSLWYETFHDRMIRPDDSIKRFINYIRMNPVKKELVKAPEDWKFIKINQKLLENIRKN